jgi:hypothetical protein
MSVAVKTAISLPRRDFDQLELFRKRTHISRSKIMLEALRTWLRLQHQAALEQRYVEGYERQPDRVSDVNAFYRAGLASLSEEPW